ncbi:uncharacterized protein L969DRAFT_47383 [Mixia osmundae IAM 14324]|uniref:Uncharacterized protein n=1 Tax=Mixia osmundae (strain CBS 9802 / IAM 14324 / JCM 22182 / KY 12970) TaxID=764103 RepID=G7E6I8_MIXOS|nr:uncharacterized protein L969DRAFT_47383 [Mixia osmundae IAM 14324]KEI40394.1 hypothetical protein L969DRAFT_47383 [Mixia osmundae IAM 14324]GAA98448.1 hypothetical protein E5Q_05134 [Mixia osmundae IAM 14324]
MDLAPLTDAIRSNNVNLGSSRPDRRGERERAGEYTSKKGDCWAPPVSEMR